MLAFPGEELPSLVAISFLEIAGRGPSLANSIIMAGRTFGIPLDSGLWKGVCWTMVSGKKEYFY